MGNDGPVPPEYSLIESGDVVVHVEGLPPGLKFRRPAGYGKQQHIMILQLADALVFKV